MPDVVIDTNPLAYIYRGVPGVGDAYAELLGELGGSGNLLIPRIVYGELSLVFEGTQALDAFIADTGIVVEAASAEAHAVAAQRWQAYNRRRILMCARCGEKIGTLRCGACNATIHIRQHILSDFLIGAFALQAPGACLVTHDRGYFSTYFPELKIISV